MGPSQQSTELAAPDSAPLATSPRDVLISRLKEANFPGLLPELSAAIMLDGLPLQGPGAETKRASADEIFSSLKASLHLKPGQRQSVHEQVSLLVNAEVLVGKRIGQGSELRCSLTMHPERVQSAALQSAVFIALEERASRWEALRPITEPPRREEGYSNPTAFAGSEVERKARREEKAKAAVLRGLDHASSAFVEALSGLVRDVNTLVAASHLGRNITARSGSIFASAEYALSLEQFKIVLNWLEKLSGSESNFGGFAEGAVLVRKGSGGRAQDIATSIRELERWRAEHITPNENRAKKLLAAVREQLASTAERASVFRTLANPTAEDIDRVPGPIAAVVQVLPDRELKSRTPEVLQTLICRHNSILIEALLEVDGLRRACGLPAAGGRLLHELELRQQRETEIRASIKQHANDLSQRLLAWDRAREVLRDEGSALFRAFSCEDRPEDAKIAGYWDSLKEVGDRAVLSTHGKNPRLSDFVRSSMALALGAPMLPSPRLVRMEAQMAEVERMNRKWVEEASQAGIQAIDAFLAMEQEVGRLPFADHSTTKLHRTFGAVQEMLAEARKRSADDESDEAIKIVEDLVDQLRNLARVVEAFGDEPSVSVA